MPVPKIQGLPDGWLVGAFRGIETILREDPVLARVIRTWRTMQGNAVDFNPPEVSDMPLLRMSTDDSSLLVNWTETDKINFTIRIELFVDGTNADNMLNLWEAFHSAITPRMTKPFRNTTIERFLREQTSGRHVLYSKVITPNFRLFRAGTDPNMPPGPNSLRCESRMVLMNVLTPR